MNPYESISEWIKEDPQWSLCTFFEGEAFKAIWRKGAQRTLGLGKAGNTALRDAEKMAHYGARELAHEQQLAAAFATGGEVGASVYRLGEQPSEQVATLPPNQWMRGDRLQGTSGTEYEFVGLAGRYADVIRYSDGESDKALLSCLTWVSCPEATAPWMPYTGGPAPDLEYVEVMTACGEPKVGPPSAFIWGGHGTKGRITHYRPAVRP